MAACSAPRRTAGTSWRSSGSSWRGRRPAAGSRTSAGSIHKVRLAITNEKLVVLGLNADGITSIDELHQGIGRLIGVEATISISHGGDEGQFTNVSVLTAKTGESDVPVDTRGLTSEEEDFADSLGDDDDDESGF